MEEQMRPNVSIIRIFVSSPGDVSVEREEIEKIIDELNRTIGEENRVQLKVVKWETHVTPGMSHEGPQDKINKDIGIYDIFIGIMWHRFGTPTKRADSGTEEEFRKAYRQWLRTESPNIMFYFCQKRFTPQNTNEAEQYAKVLKFKDELFKKGIVGEYPSPQKFANKVRPDLYRTILELIEPYKRNANIKKKRKTHGRQLFKCEDISIDKIDDIIVPDQTDMYSSFQPRINNVKTNKKKSQKIIPKFYRILASTTPGVVRNDNIANSVHIIKDPIRPFDIQVGLTRSMRKQGNPEAIPELTNMDIGQVKRMYPFLQGADFKWVRMVLAELSADPQVLEYICTSDLDADVKQIAAKNPSVTNKVKQKVCLFCDPHFVNKRHLYESNVENGTVIIANDFPYGPLFHYIAFPQEPIHAWEELTEKIITDMNQTIHQFLQKEMNSVNHLHGSIGLFIGFNSSIRHLVLRKRTKSSAGASISHVHKQIWGMLPGSVNIGNYTNKICEAFQNRHIDYLKAYIDTLEQAGMVLYSDSKIILYIPFGQISIHELQIMFKRKGVNNYLDLLPDEINSLSKAEFIVARIYGALQIGSFNELFIQKPFKKLSSNASSHLDKDSSFRLIVSFITREIDLAVSELNQLYVVDKYPEDTLREIRMLWQQIKNECSLNYNI